MLAVIVPVMLALGITAATGFPKIIEIAVVFAVGCIMIGIAAVVCASLLAFIPWRWPWLTLSAGLAMFVACSVTVWKLNVFLAVAAAMAGLSLVVAAWTAVAVIWLFKHRRSPRVKAYGALACVLLIAVMLWRVPPSPLFGAEEDEAEYDYEQSAIPIAAPDPSKQGGYEVISFTYGSGDDERRARYADEVLLQTEPFDASEMITQWSASREWFWGFDETKLPLNGQVWLPDGDGPFPLVVVVHGNHPMTDFSDEGYAYLGELLASRGFITVSIDQNYLNHSFWSGNLSDDMKLRAEVILEHLAVLEQWNEQGSPDNPLYDAIDMEQIALIGHSRGGQAAAIAAGDEDEEFDIQSVIALAPTDFAIDDKFIWLNDVNYLVLQGSQDADVRSFSGDRQYERVRLSADSDAIKASLYIAGANHGQFNTDWGIYDMNTPVRYLLNQSDTIPGDDQRQIALTYISGFLEATLRENDAYRIMFKDYRYALGWLPEGLYVNRYEDSTFTPIATFEAYEDMYTIKADGVESHESDLGNRYGGNRHNKGTWISWSNREGAYTLQLQDEQQAAERLAGTSALVFELANVAESEQEEEPNLSVRLTDRLGYVYSFPLSAFKPIQPVIHTQYTKSALLEQVVEKGEVGLSTEPVLQTYIIPVSFIQRITGGFDPAELAEISFVFDRSTAGRIIIDNIGFKSDERYAPLVEPNIF